MHRRVDIGFVVDTTGSMGTFLTRARSQMVTMLGRLSAAADVDMKCVLIDYRDHPPQDPTYAAKLQTGKEPVSDQVFQSKLSALQLGHGGDAPESVLDGLDMLGDVQWRPHSRRIAFLVGDAPAHGYYGRHHDSWPDGCPCGKTAESVTSRLEDAGIVLYGVCVSGLAETEKCFDEFCSYTGGSMVSGEGVSVIENYLKDEFGKLDLDKRVLEAINADPDWTVHGVAVALEEQEGEIDQSVRRLLGRDLVPVPEAA